NPQIPQIEIQPAQTGGVMSSCEPLTGGPLSRPSLFPPREQPRRFGGRVLLSSGDGRAMYVGSNGNRACETCGGAAVALSKHQFGEKPWLLSFCLALARKRYHKRNGGTCVSKAENTAVKIAKGYDRIAAVLAKTVAQQGDAFELD